MTEIAGFRSGAFPSRDVARLRTLSRQLSAALAEFNEVTSREPGSPGARSLARLVRGEGRPQDEVMLGVVVPHSRLLWISVPSDRNAERLVDEVGAEGRVVGLIHGETDVLLLVPDLPSRDGASRSREAAQRVARRTRGLVPTARIGVSSPLQSVHDLPSAVDEARGVAGFGAELTFADDHWARLGVEGLAEQLSRCLTISNPLSVLARNEMLAESVAAWLDSGRSVPAAAEALGLHPNTLRYRLIRVSDVTGLDLGDPDALLLAQLLLRRRPSD
jgi:sugar diacid utilization regulator